MNVNLKTDWFEGLRISDKLSKSWALIAPYPHHRSRVVMSSPCHVNAMRRNPKWTKRTVLHSGWSKHPCPLKHKRITVSTYPTKSATTSKLSFKELGIERLPSTPKKNNFPNQHGFLFFVRTRFHFKTQKNTKKSQHHNHSHWLVNQLPPNVQPSEIMV